MALPILLLGAAALTGYFLSKVSSPSDEEESASSSGSTSSDNDSGSGNSGIDSDSICTHIEGHTFGEGRSYYGDRDRPEDLSGFRSLFGDDNSS